MEKDCPRCGGFSCQLCNGLSFDNVSARIDRATNDTILLLNL